MLAIAFQSPVLSSFLLVIAGILVGYALSYPYRGEAEHLEGQLQQTRNHNKDLQSAIRQQQQVLETATVVDDESEAKLRELLLHLQDSKAQNSSLFAELENTLEQLNSAKRELGELRGEVAGLDIVKQQQEEHVDNYRRLELTIESLTKRLHEVEEEKIQSSTQLENERKQRMALDEALQYKERQLSQTEQNAGVIEEIQNQLRENQASLEQATANLMRVSAERDEAAEQLSIQTHELAAIARDRDDHRRALDTIERLRNESADNVTVERERIEELDARLQQTELMLEQSRESAERSAHDCSIAEQERERALTVLDESRQRILELESDVGRLQHDTDRIRSQREEVLATLRVEQEKTAQLGMRVREQQNEIQSQQQELVAQNRELQITAEQFRSIKPVSEEFALMQSRLESATVELQQLQQERDGALDAKARVENLVQEMREELQKNSELITNSRRARDERAEQLERELDNERRTVAELRPTVAELQSKLTKQEERISTIANEKEFEMTTLCTQLAESRNRVEEQQRLTSQLRAELADKVDLIAHLENERDDALTSSQRQTIVQPQHDTRLESAPQLATSLTRRDKRRGIIYTRPPENQDDLKRISGVADKLEQRLNDFGIYTYEQIMTWDDSNVQEFGRLLAFKDRIVRDDWVGQARGLYHETYSPSQKRSA